MTASLSPDHPLPSADSWAARAAPSPAVAAAHAAIEARARRTARSMIKDRAKAYALRPRELDAIRPGLFGCSPSCLVKVLAMIAAAPYQNPSLWPRHFGFGGEVPALNLRGAMLYARYLRAKAHQLARRAA